jgi:hypothetical protein
MTKILIATLTAASDESDREAAAEIEGVGDPTLVLEALVCANRDAPSPEVTRTPRSHRTMGHNSALISGGAGS